VLKKAVELLPDKRIVGLLKSTLCRYSSACPTHATPSVSQAKALYEMVYSVTELPNSNTGTPPMQKRGNVLL
jgi:hypothetical protein